MMRKEGSGMLPLEAIGVLVILYCFFMYGTLKALRARKTARLKDKAKAEPAVVDIIPEAAAGATPPAAARSAGR
jgi:Flp pilus assembly protein TadB